MKITSSKFVISAIRRSQYPTDGLPEFMLVGRSNVGKSSFINTITNNKKMARVSNTPGKTRNLNFYLLNDSFYFVDVPGNVISSNKSGNAKAEKEIKEQLRRHLFMAEVSLVRVSTTPLRVSAKIKTRSAVMAGDFLSMFGIRLFEYEGNDQAQGDFEIDQIRRWNALEGAMD